MSADQRAEDVLSKAIAEALTNASVDGVHLDVIRRIVEAEVENLIAFHDGDHEVED